MHTIHKFLGSAILLFAMCLSTMAFANDLDLLSITPPEAGTKAAEAHVEFLFDYTKKGESITIKEADLSEFKLSADNVDLPILHSKLIPFKEGKEPVVVLIVFPQAESLKKPDSDDKGVLEESIASMVQLFKERNIDLINAMYYTDAPHKLSSDFFKGTDAAELASKIEDLKASDEQSPDLGRAYNQIVKTIDADAFKDVKLKYVVLVTDGTGRGLSDRDKKSITGFTKELQKLHVMPIVVQVPSFLDDSGEASYDNETNLRLIADKGVYKKAKDYTRDLDQKLGDVFEYIMGHKLVEADVDSSAISAGTYTMTLQFRDDKATYAQFVWPELKKSKAWLWFTIGGVVLLGLIIFGIVMARRRDPEDDPEEDDTPQEVCCATCGKVLPDQLSGFRGEFCLSGGRPDCPYYNMPDKGKITITRGALADITFFIKKEVTTIGSNVENDIFLADKTVSKKHAAIKVDEGKRYEIRDFGSSNGLYINNEKVSSKFLRDGDKIRFGAIETEFKLK